MSNRPEIALFFKEVDKELLRDPGEELKKVLTFKERIIAEKEILFDTFEGRTEFEGKIRAVVTAYVQKLRDAETQKISDEAQVTPPEQGTASEPGNRPTQTTAIAAKAAHFLRNFLETAEVDDESYEAVDVARFRLLANAVAKQGNDETTIGPHDANLLFTHRSMLDLDLREKTALARSGIEHFTSENVPLWHWYSGVDGFELKLCSVYSVYRTPRFLQGNSLRAMQLIEEQLPSSDDLPRDFFLSRWLDKDTPGDRKSAALSYLSVCGLPEDLPEIKKEFERGEYQTRSAALDAIVRINLRQGREQAIKALYELQPESVDTQLLTHVFDKPRALNDEILTEGTNHRSALVRRLTASILSNRNRLATSDAERLLSDTDQDVRFIALSSLARGGRIFSEEQARATLVRQAEGTLLMGFPAGERQFKSFKETMLATKTDAELETLTASASVFDRDAKLALLKRHFPSKQEELCRLIDNEFKEDFASSIAPMISRYGEENQLVKDTRGLEEFLRKGFTRRALDIVCNAGAPEHLGLVRNALKSSFLDYSPLDINYLRKHGEWQDVPLIIAALDRPETGVSLLASGNSTKYGLAAKAIYEIGKERLPELLRHDMSKQLLAQLIVEVSDKNFRLLSDDLIEELLLDTADSVRKACSLKAVRTLTKRRLKKILDDYLAVEDQRYYNVIHWLDLGISAPSEIARRAAWKIIAKEWPDDIAIFE